MYQNSCPVTHRDIWNVVVMEQGCCDHDSLVAQEVGAVPGSIREQALCHALKPLPGLARRNGIPHLRHPNQAQAVAAMQ